MYSGDYWISIFPGIALLITIVSINLVGDQLRDIFNPRLQGRLWLNPAVKNFKPIFTKSGVLKAVDGVSFK